MRLSFKHGVSGYLSMPGKRFPRPRFVLDWAFGWLSLRLQTNDYWNLDHLCPDFACGTTLPARISFQGFSIVAGRVVNSIYCVGYIFSEPECIERFLGTSLSL